MGIDVSLVTDILNLFRGITSTEKIVFNLVHLLSLRLGFQGVIVTGLMDDGMLQICGLSEGSASLDHKLDIIGLENILDLESSQLGTGRLVMDANSCNLEPRVNSRTLTSTDVMLFPIKDKLDHEWGWLFLDTVEEIAMTDNLLFTLDMTLAMAHNALENADVNTEIKVELSRNRFLYEITNLLNSDFEFTDSVTEVVHRLQSSFGYFWVGFWTSHTEGTLNLLTQAGNVAIDDEIVIPEGKDGGVIGIVAANGHFFTVNDALNSRQNKVLGMQGFLYELAVPIIKNEKVYGVLDIRSDKTYAFDQKTRRFARIVANQLAQAIYTRKSIEDRMKELRIRRSIIDVGRIISSILDLESLLKKSLDVLLNTFNYWGASIYLSDDSGENLSFAAQAGAIGNPKRKSVIKTGKEGIVGLAASTR